MRSPAPEERAIRSAAHRKWSIASLRARLLLTALSWAIVAIPLGGVALALSFRSVIAEKFDDQLDSLLLLLIGSAETTPAGEILIARPLSDPRFQQAYSGWYWAIRSGDETVLRSRSLWDLPFNPDDAPVSATPRRRTIPDLLGAELRVAEQTVTLPGVPSPVTFAVAGDLASLHEEARDFNRLLWLSLLALGAGLVLAVATQVSLGLKPLRRVAQDIERIRTGDARQLSNTGLREIDALVHEVNTLIDQERAQLERAREQMPLISRMRSRRRSPCCVHRRFAKRATNNSSNWIRCTESSSGNSRERRAPARAAASPRRSMRLWRRL